jgi:hypothetical protein
MIEQTRLQQGDIETAHRERAMSNEGDVGEPLYGLSALPGHGGEAPVEQSAEDEAVSEGGRPGAAVDEGTNLTWGIILGGAMLLFLVAAILIVWIGPSYSAAIITQYPVK